MTRWFRPVAFGTTAVLLLLAAAVNATTWAGHDIGPWLGVDFALFREFGQRWLETGSMYLPSQLEGPYSVWWTYDKPTTPSIYPPAAGPLFGALALLPLQLAALAWWGVPIGILASALARWRPAPWSWPIMAALLVHPQLPITYIVGSSTMWAVALVALGLVYKGPAVLILLKPTFAPFALIGMRDWRWWAVAGVIGIVTLAGPWRDYLTVLTNGTDSGGFLYSLTAFPLMLVPVVAWLGRSREARAWSGVPVRVFRPYHPARRVGAWTWSEH